jgi:LIVCS family branched-chain amino acid:cation transporter
MKNKAIILSTGLAMFSMFFGSGNLVFPIDVGHLSGGHTILASIGFILTGVLVPFLGIFAMLLFRGDTNSFFSRLGKFAPFWFSLICLSIMGPFGVLARCITVSHSAFCSLAPNTPLWIFSLASCCLLFITTFKKSRIVPILGSILTPILLISLTAVAFFGIFSGTLPEASAEHGWESLKIGFFKGYQTMDLLAAFFFSTFVINHLQQKSKEESSSLPLFFKSAMLGAGLLSLVYVIFVVLGSMYAPHLQGVSGPEMLTRIAFISLGTYAAPIACTAILLACFTTAMVLTSLFSDFLRKEVSKDKIPASLSIMITLAIGFFISTLGFNGIMSFIGPILEAIYPALIVLTLTNIAHKTVGWKFIRIPTIFTFLLKFLSSI